ncbi:hypothetical protein MJ1_0312 [Nanobdella aerobiophila]|uniref:Uncharacterized protein n=1 Tax=Nanobdella aerobiophila TaxID=2586965 RepID=A0A915SFL6_9ARCH|nr:hypothetical protein [Nanobdella aerobiophila]BBL45479.1 hypothetical protein MJ1_0312 [Nanobdella aerobiophila]
MVDPIRDAEDHDIELNKREIQVLKNIKNNIKSIKEIIDNMEEITEELENFNKMELSRPLLKEDEYKIFINIIELQKKLNNNILSISQDILRYKILLDQEVF